MTENDWSGGCGAAICGNDVPQNVANYIIIIDVSHLEILYNFLKAFLIAGR